VVIPCFFLSQAYRACCVSSIMTNQMRVLEHEAIVVTVGVDSGRGACSGNGRHQRSRSGFRQRSDQCIADIERPCFGMGISVLAGPRPRDAEFGMRQQRVSFINLPMPRNMIIVAKDFFRVILLN